MMKRPYRYLTGVAGVFQADDAVYLSDESLLQEYVLNEDGAIYTGTWDDIQCLPWNYGQVTITHPQPLLRDSCPCLSSRSGGQCEVTQQCGIAHHFWWLHEETCGREVTECSQTTQTRACSLAAPWEVSPGDRQPVDRRAQ